MQMHQIKKNFCFSSISGEPINHISCIVYKVFRPYQPNLGLHTLIMIEVIFPPIIKIFGGSMKQHREGFLVNF